MSSSRPGWMEGGARRPKPPQQPQPSPPSPEQRIVVRMPEGPTTHRNVVVGVTLLAIVTLFSVFFWIGIGIAAAINPPEAGVTFSEGIELVILGDYLALPRLLVGFFAGVLGTAAAWHIVDNAID